MNLDTVRDFGESIFGVEEERYCEENRRLRHIGWVIGDRLVSQGTPNTPSDTKIQWEGVKKEGKMSGKFCGECKHEAFRHQDQNYRCLVKGCTCEGFAPVGTLEGVMVITGHIIKTRTGDLYIPDKGELVNDASF